MNACAMLLQLLTVLTVLARASPGDYAACDAAPAPVTTPDFCWDAALAAVRPNKTDTFAGDMACCPLNLTAPLVVTDGQALYVGLAEVGANTSEVQGSVRVAPGGQLAVTSMNLTVRGDFVIDSGARLVVSESNATQTRIRVEGCLRIAANNTELIVELAVSDGNQSRAYLIFEVPSGCVNGSFATINASYTLSAGQTTYYPPGMTSCPQPVGLAVLVNIACDPPAGPPPPPPPPPAPVWLPGDIFPPDNTTTSAPAVPASSSNSNGALGPQAAPFNWTLWGVVLGVIGAGILAAVITAALLLRVRAARRSLFPYRDRAYYQSQTPVATAPVRAPVDGRGYTLSTEPRPYTTAQH
jgi:hypothetical protein